MIVEDTKDLVETADYVIIEAVLVDDGLRYKQLPVGIKGKNGDNASIDNANVRKDRAVYKTVRPFFIPIISKCNKEARTGNWVPACAICLSGIPCRTRS